MSSVTPGNARQFARLACTSFVVSLAAAFAASLRKFLIPLALSTLIVGCSSDSDSDGNNVGDLTAAAETGQATEFLGSGSNAVVTSGDAVAAGTPFQLSDTAIGTVLAAGTSSRTLYTFAGDTAGVSNCFGNCTVLWTPFTATLAQQSALEALVATSALGSVGRSLGLIERNDSSLQWTFNQRPLYHFSGDGAAGETNGENFNGEWFVARPMPVELFETDSFNGPLIRGRGSINSGIDEPSLRRASLDGLTLYIFTRDSAGLSVCNAGCAEDWPPLYADRGAVAADGFTLITRSNGAAQWAYNNQPLYFYIGDDVPGDVSGDGVGLVWFVARP